MKLADQILRNAKTIAVVGLSSNPMRDSYRVSGYMQDAGYRIIPVNPQETEVLGERSYPNLTAIPEPVDIVNVFRRSEFVAGIVDESIAIQAKAIWMQLGIIDEAAAAKAQSAGLSVIMDRCIMIEHRLMQ